jgi:hypothetical protein
MIWVPSEEVSITRLRSARSAVSASSWGLLRVCVSIIGGVNNECGCQNQCTNSIDLTASREQTITVSLDKTEKYFAGVGWRKLYEVSGCFWVIKTTSGSMHAVVRE